MIVGKDISSQGRVAVIPPLDGADIVVGAKAIRRAQPQHEIAVAEEIGDCIVGVAIVVGPEVGEVVRMNLDAQLFPQFSHQGRIERFVVPDEPSGQVQQPFGRVPRPPHQQYAALVLDDRRGGRRCIVEILEAAGAAADLVGARQLGVCGPAPWAEAERQHACGCLAHVNLRDGPRQPLLWPLTKACKGLVSSNWCTCSGVASFW